MNDRELLEQWAADHDGDWWPPEAIRAARAGRGTYMSVSGRYELPVPSELKQQVAEEQA